MGRIWPKAFGLGCTFVPLNLLALSGLPHHILTQGTALRALMRMLGGSIGIAILETQLTQNTQIAHSRLIEHLRPDSWLAQFPHLPAPFSLTDPTGIAALNHEVTRQAAMIAYLNDFAPEDVRNPRLPALIAAGALPPAPIRARGSG